MIRHLCDSIRVVMGEREPGVLKRKPPGPKWLMRWYALRLPLEWPKGLPTMPGVDAQKDGTLPVGLAEDKQALSEAISDFVAKRDSMDGFRHPIFGHMSRRDWGVWAFRHVDHHFRQFGA